jgi:hypothetical protein
VWISILYTRIQCVKGVGENGALGVRQINTCRKVPLQVNFFTWRHFAVCLINYQWLCRSEISSNKSVPDTFRTVYTIFNFRKTKFTVIRRNDFVKIAICNVQQKSSPFLRTTEEKRVEEK